MSLSMRARLTVWYTAVVVVVLIAAAATVLVLERRFALTRLDDEVARLMLTLQGVMRTEFGEGLDLPATAREASEEVAAPDRVLAVTGADGRLLAMWGRRPPAAWEPPAASARTLETVAIGGMSGRLLSEPVSYQGHHYVTHVWAPLDALASQSAQLRRTLLVAVLVALAIAAAGGWVVGRQVLLPLSQIAAQARAISEDDPAARLSAPHPTDELGTLAAAFNGLLDRLSAVLHGQRQFMADASHELRTPVSVVRSTAQVTLAVDERSVEDYRESMTIVGEQADRLARLVDAMFLLSRAEARGLPLVREVVYLDEIVADCTRALRVLASERHVQLETCAKDEIMFVGDDRLLRQMVSNLVDNAIRHASASAAVDARATADRIEILVSDDGRGVPSEDRERIFERFVRLGSPYAGAGLGLPIARWIAEAHGGRLTLRSSGPSGTTFAITLPMNDGTSDSPA